MFNHGNRHDKTGRSTGAPRDQRFRKRNGPPRDEPWCWLSRSMLESVAFRNLSGPAFMALMRLLLEHMSHAGTKNGELIVTYDQFADYGIRRQSVGQALKSLEQAGFITINRGVRSYGPAHRPNRYGLTWLPTADGQPATNAWR